MAKYIYKNPFCFRTSAPDFVIPLQVSTNRLAARCNYSNQAGNLLEFSDKSLHLPFTDNELSSIYIGILHNPFWELVEGQNPCYQADYARFAE